MLPLMYCAWQAFANNDHEGEGGHHEEEELGRGIHNGTNKQYSRCKVVNLEKFMFSIFLTLVIRNK